MIVVLSCSFSLAWAQENKMTTGDNSYWQCRAYDQDNYQWTAKSTYERTAVNKAYEACKKQSKKPETCKTAKEYCEGFINGISTRPMWQCTALDRMAKPWVSAVYSNQDDAALGAKAYCQERSTVPTTCYVNMVTCKNLNAQP